MNQWKADLVLALLTLVTGSTYFISKVILQTVEPFNFLVIRFGLSALILYAIFYKRIHLIKKQVLLPCVRVGLLLATGIVLMTLGLQSTASGQVAFIISMEVVLVPLVLLIFYGIRIDIYVLLGLPIAVVGLAMLTLQSGFDIRQGDLLVIVSAFCFALYTIYNSRYAARYDPLVLAWVQVSIVAIVSVICLMLVGEPDLSLGGEVWSYIAFLVIVATVMRFCLQTVAQKYTTATHTSIIFMLEPVVAGIFGWWFLNELLTSQAAWGCALILIATFITKAKYFRRMNTISTSA